MADDRASVELRLHVYEGLLTALDRRRELLDLVTECHTREQAEDEIPSAFGLDETQAVAAMDLQMHRFTQEQRTRIASTAAEMKRMLKSM